MIRREDCTVQNNGVVWYGLADLGLVQRMGPRQEWIWRRGALQAAVGYRTRREAVQALINVVNYESER